MKKYKIHKYITVISIIILLLSCNKEKDNLYSISISVNKMVGTPAEKFSLGQIKLFQVSNSFISERLELFANDTLNKNLAIAPFSLLNSIMLDSTQTQWQNAFFKHYNLSPMSHLQVKNMVESFDKTVKEIDSSINIVCQTIEKLDCDTCLDMFQSFQINLMYENIAPNDIDNIFTTIDNKKPRMDFITICDTFPIFQSEEEHIAEIPIGNGNYTLLLIKPLTQDIKKYVQDFTEEKYFNCINSLQLQKINISLPLIQITDTISNFPLPSFASIDTNISFQKSLNLYTDFSIRQADKTDISLNKLNQQNNAILQSNNSSLLKYASPFMFIVRGKNSNLIMFIGYFCKV